MNEIDATLLAHTCKLRADRGFLEWAELSLVANGVRISATISSRLSNTLAGKSRTERRRRDPGRQPVNPRRTNEIIRHQARRQLILSPARRSLCGQKISQLLAVRRDHEDEQLRRRSRTGIL